MKFKIATLSALLMVCIACQPKLATTDISEPTEKLVADMSNDTFIGTKSIGRTMDESPAYTRRMAMANHATTAELVSLAKNENPVVGLAAFEGLVNRDYTDVIPLLDFYASEKVMVNYIKGDLSNYVSTLYYASVVVLEMSVESGQAVGNKAERFGITSELRGQYLERIQQFEEINKKQ